MHYPCGPHSTLQRPPLSPEERERLILEMLPYVKYRAARVFNRVNRGVDLSEIVSSGILGLLDAADRFDPSRGIKFQTFAQPRVDGAIKDALRKMDWASRGMRQRRKLYESTFHTLRDRFGRDPSCEEIAAEMGLDEQGVQGASREITFIPLGVFTEAVTGESKPYDRVSLRDEETEDPYAVCERSEIMEILVAELRKLDEREYRILSLYYFNELNMKEIGLALGITESRVSQLHNQSVLKLKSRLQAVFKRR